MICVGPHGFSGTVWTGDRVCSFESTEKHSYFNLIFMVIELMYLFDLVLKLLPAGGLESLDAQQFCLDLGPGPLMVCL